MGTGQKKRQPYPQPLSKIFAAIRNKSTTSPSHPAAKSAIRSQWADWIARGQFPAERTYHPLVRLLLQGLICKVRTGQTHLAQPLTKVRGGERGLHPPVAAAGPPYDGVRCTDDLHNDIVVIWPHH